MIILRDEVVGPAGPTTATRMDKFTRTMLEKTGLAGMIGKAERGPVAIDAIRDNKAVSMIAVGGAAYLVAKAITVFVRTSPFQRDYGYYSNAKTIDFPIATNNSIETVKTAVSILESIFKNGYRYQKAGVMLTGLRNDDGRKNLFSSEKDEKIKSLMQSIDNTNYRYGRSTLSLASAGVHKKWNMRRQYSSKIDTADFYCLPTIRAV